MDKEKKGLIIAGTVEDVLKITARLKKKYGPGKKIQEILDDYGKDVVILC